MLLILIPLGRHTLPQSLEREELADSDYDSLLNSGEPIILYCHGNTGSRSDFGYNSTCFVLYTLLLYHSSLGCIISTHGYLTYLTPRCI